MVIEATEAFLEALRTSNLLAEEDLVAARKAAERAPDAKTLARILVQQEKLTRWQAGQLLIGRPSFFVGKYKLIELLGRGGMGRVFLARHTMMNRPVALKLVSEQLGKDPAALARFLTEARAAAALDHPNIVHAYNVDTEGDRYYMVLEYVEGQDLQRLVESKGPLPFEQAADYIRQAADGLVHAHGKGMVHCDIKPSNLLVSQQGVVKILDMGMARVVGEVPSGKEGGSGGLVGTIDYMAPEQAAQNPDLDHRADIYSLGCTFYFLLTGHPPFPDGTLTERIAKHQTQEPRSILEERPDAPRDLADICRTMMAKDPAQRFQSAAEVSATLAEWRMPARRVLRAVAIDADEAGESSDRASGTHAAAAKDGVAAAAGADTPIGRREQNRRRLAVVGGVAGVAVLVLAAVLFIFFRRPPQEPSAKLDDPRARAAAPKPEPEAPWKGLKLAVDQPQPEAGPEKTATPAAAPNPAAKPKPTKAEPSKADASKTPAKPEAPKEPPKPETKPPTPPKEAPKPGKEEPKAAAKPQPKEAVKEAPKEPPKEPLKEPSKEPSKQSPKEPSKASPKEPPKPAAPADPLRDVPKTVDLPIFEQGGRVQPLRLAKFYGPDDLAWSVELAGGETAIRGNRKFTLAARQAEGKPSWVVSLSTVRGKEETQTEVARFYREKEGLMFQWLEGADEAANHLRNCILEIRAGGAPRPLPLRSPQKVEPLAIDFVRGANETLEVEWLPNPTALRVEVTAIEAAGGKRNVLFACEPKQPGGLKPPIVVGLLRKDLYNQEHPVFKFQLAPQIKGPSLALDLRLRKDKDSLVLPKNYNPEQAKLLLVNPLREIDSQLKDDKKKHDQKLRMQKDELDRWAWVADTYLALHKTGRLHFRVFAEVGNQTVDLAFTAAPEKPAAKK